MLRQMEFDADRYEARVVGSKCFAETSERVMMLTLGSRAAFSSLTAAWRERQLCDDLAMLIGHREKEMPEDVRRKLKELQSSAKTKIFDTHPSDARRIANAAREGTDGVFRLEIPAAGLFSDFGEICKDATMLFYMQALGNQVKPEHVVPTESLIKDVQKLQANNQCANRFFQGLLNPLRPVFPAHPPQITQEGQAAEELLSLRSAAIASATAAREAARSFDAADQKLCAVARVNAAGLAGVKVTRAADYELPSLEAGALRQLQQTNASARDAASKTVIEAIEPCLRRLELAMAIERLRRPSRPAAESYDVAAEQPEDLIWQALICLRSAEGIVERLRQSVIALAEMLRHLQREGNPQPLIQAILNRGRQVRQVLEELHAATRQTPYPYQHNEAGATIARYAARTIPPEKEVGAVYETASAALQAMYDLYMRLMSDLSQRAEAVEGSLGLEPLALPPEAAR
jgi:hypothetical protein